MAAAAAEHVAPVLGLPCWVNLMVSDLKATRAFYSAVLGWQFGKSSLGERFLIASAQGLPVAGIGERHPDVVAPASAWTPYFAVADADTTAARIQERGATLAVGPIVLGNGRAGLAADRDGATFGFWEGAALTWSVGQGSAPARLSLQTRDVFDAAAFYGDVFGWPEAHGIDIAYKHDHVVVEHDGRSVLTLRGGGVQTSAEARQQPRWLVNFEVDSVERAVAAALEAGGRKQHHGASGFEGFSRTLRDPEGGLFTLTRRGA